MTSFTSISKLRYLVLLFIFGCSTYQTTKLRYTAEILEAKNPAEKQTSVRRIAVNKFQTRPASFSTFAGENFTNNLRFYLMKEGIETLIQEIPAETKQASSNTSNSTEGIGNTIGPAPSTTPTMFSSNVFLESGEKPIELPKESIQKACSLVKCDLYIDGYIYEKRMGNILDEEITTGIFVRLYSQTGILLGQVKVSSSATMEIFQNNSVLAEMLAEKISNGIGYSNRSGFKWKFWE
ncbi:lipoprotein [Leptospira sarikeiensis]|uniref:Lipoprotein n=1 Tax=Leptospira sarikeiensis TaxID=2484943 RepID=A0A4R9KBT5_9LEPT|nr:lipoprotein [Leptospira sarikeiensis]TGL64204.1 lipoprotein [Leptospira sarikeiensis]